jgi:organic hydroperoxide reductase OsmC/OhrA
VPIEDAEVDVRCSFDVADKLGLEGPGAAFEEVAFAVTIQSPAPAEQVKKLIAHAERGCHAEQTLRQPIPVKTTARLNGQALDLGSDNVKP